MNTPRALLVLLLLPGAALAQGVGQLSPGYVWGNQSAVRAPASPATLTSMLDRALGSTRGALVTRQSSGWLLLVPGTAGQPLLSAGTGADPAYGILPLSAGGTAANLTASNGGLFYSTASAGAILAGTATAGQIVRSGAAAPPSWSTATYPASTAAGQVLASSSANVIAGTAAPSLGIAGSVVGSLGFANLTSGSITLQPATGALGSSVLTLPAVTDTLVCLTCTQTLVGKTFSGFSASISTKTASYTATSSDYAILVNAASGAATVTLPASPATGQFLVVKKIDATSNFVTVSGNGKNIDGVSSQIINSQWSSLALQYDGSSWYLE